MRQVNGRIERFRLVAIVVVILAIVGAALSAYAITVQTNSIGLTKPAGDNSHDGNSSGQTPSSSEQGATIAPRPTVEVGAATDSQRSDSPSQRSDSRSSNRSAETPHSDKTPVAIRCDVDCTVTIDGKSVGLLKATVSTLQELSFGDHLVEATDRTGSTSRSQKVVAEGTDQLVVIIELHKMLFASNVAWLLGKWERRTSAVFDTNSAGPSGKYRSQCDSGRRPEEAHFMYLVTGASGQSAAAALMDAGEDVGAGWATMCKATCRAITVSQKSENKLDLAGIPSDSFAGEYTKVN